jgi:hypothetical protein
MTTTLITVAVVLIAAVAMVRLIMRAVRLLVIAIVGVAVLGSAGVQAHLIDVQRHIQTIVAQEYAHVGAGVTMPTTTQARVLEAQLGRIVRDARVQSSCRGGMRVIVVQYREPDPPLGLGREQSTTIGLSGQGDCAHRARP